MNMLIDHIMTLLMLTLLQAVLGFDNLLYISIESKRVQQDKQASLVPCDPKWLADDSTMDATPRAP